MTHNSPESSFSQQSNIPLEAIRAAHAPAFAALRAEYTEAAAAPGHMVAGRHEAVAGFDGTPVKPSTLDAPAAEKLPYFWSNPDGRTVELRGLPTREEVIGNALAAIVQVETMPGIEAHLQKPEDPAK